MADLDLLVPDKSVRELVSDAPPFSFFAAVRLIQSRYPQAVRVGYQGPPARECIRFRPVLELSFANADIEEVRTKTNEDGAARFEVTTTFLGLFGPASPLPSFYTEDLMGQEEDSLIRGFLDLFHHRFLSLFYRVWEKYRPDAQFRTDFSDFYTQRMLALLGVSPDALPHSHSVNPLHALAYAGLMTQQPRSAHLLEGLLSDYFPQARVAVEPFEGAWVAVPQDQQNRLGRSNVALGRDLTVGGEVFSRAGTFKVSVSELSFNDFMEFLPHGDKMPQLRELVDIFNTDCLDYVVEYCIRAEEVPGLNLSGKTAYLGWSSWLGQGKPGEKNCVKFSIRGWFHGRR
jgi:type VI secretion system protein ImpH